MNTLTAKDIGGLDDALRELLEKLPGRLPEKQDFFNTRFHLKVPKTSYNQMWDALRTAGDLARVKYIFDYARLYLPKRTKTLLDQAARGKATRTATDPPITDILLYQNGKPRRLGRLLSQYLPSDDGKTVLASPRPAPVKASASTAPTVIAPTRRPRTRPPPPRPASATTATNDGDAGGWWRNQKRYKNIRRLGKGGMALVYLVRDTLTDRERAAKVIDPKHRKDADYQVRFFREVRAQSALRHPNILRVLDHGRDFYIAEVCVETVSDLIRRTTIERSRALAIFDQACAGVAYAHGQRVLHRDLKPSNLLLRKSGGLVVSDFGLCKIDASEFTTITSTRASGGTFRYAAPEQWRSLKDADERADIYSLGVILQDLFLGTTQVEVGNEAAFTKLRADPFKSIVDRATAYRIEARYSTVAELRAAVKIAAGPTARPSRRK